MITLIKGQDGWKAKFEGQDAAEVISLFGTDTLPTPFGINAKPMEVMAAIRAKNPTEEIRFAEPRSCGTGCGCHTQAA